MATGTQEIAWSKAREIEAMLARTETETVCCSFYCRRIHRIYLDIGSV
jgi:hypothetical protein